MSVKIDMEMPEVCAKCPFFEKLKDQGVAFFMGLPLDGQCKALPIKDLDGKIISYQTVSTINEITNKERSKQSPLRKCEQAG